VIAAYSIAKYPDGTMSFEVMNIDQINDIRKLSRAKKGPWANPTFFPEMARKTVARLHSKQLPMSTDLDRVIHRDDPLYDFDAAREQARKIARPNTVAAALDYFGSGGEGEPPPGDTPPAKREGDGTKPDAKPEGNTGGAPGGGTGDGGLPLGDPPPKPAGPPTDAASYKTFARRVIDDVKGPDDALSLEAWFVSDAQKNMRSACGVGKADFEAVQGWVRDALDKHKPKK
jgi:hypothetical protein